MLLRRSGCALLILAACTSSKPSDSKASSAALRCSGDQSCEDTQLCIFGVCNDTCASSSDCKNLGGCLDTGRGMACLRLEDNACVQDADCPAHAHCIRGRCLSECEGRDDAPCLIGAPCSVGACSAASVDSSSAGETAAGSSGNGGANARPTPMLAGAGGGGSLGCLGQTVRCAGLERQRCDDMGVWHAVETCSKTCTPAACTEPSSSSSAGSSGSDSGSECPAGATRCDPDAAANVQTCSMARTWQASAACPSGVCMDGACTGECTPDTRRCAANIPSTFQICTAQHTWGGAQACPQGGACSGAGECAAPAAMSCMPGQSPNWYAAASQGGNPSLDDPRWGAEPAPAFAGTFGFESGSYVIVFDRLAKQLAVSLRVTAGASEAPDARDYVYFAATPNISGAPTARNVLIPLIDLRAGEGPKSIAQFAASAYVKSWQAESGGWVQHVSAWRGDANARLSWAVNLRIDLAAISIDVTKPFRIAIAAHAEGAARDLTTPVELGMLTEMPASWARARVDPTRCVDRVVLE